MARSLRQRNRIRAMSELQSIAIARFEDDGFDNVTIEEIARDAGISASTVYRYFGTKERLVIWDEADRDIVSELTSRLASHPPAIAFRDSLIAAFADEERSTALYRRVRFIYANPRVHAAAIEQDLADRSDLAVGFAMAAGRKKPTLEDDTLAGVCMAALDSAIGHWQDDKNKQRLPDLIRRAFAVIAS